MIIKVENIWQQDVPEVRDEVVDFWEKNKMLPAGVAASERVNEVVLVAREESTQAVVGISSAGQVRFKQLNNNYFFYYRSIVHPKFRVPGLAYKLIVETRDILEHYAKTMTGNKCIGMMTVVENPAIVQNINEAVWPASKMFFIGNDKQGRQVRVYYFKGATI